MSAKITVKLGKRKLELTPKEAKELHRQLDEMFEGEKQRRAAEQLAEFARKWKDQKRPEPVPFYPLPPEKPWRPFKRNPNFPWDYPPIICHKDNNRFREPDISNRRPH